MRKNLKLLRVQNFLTQEEMAQKIGCTRATYSAVESGAREGRRAFWDGLQAAFGIDSDAMWELMQNDK